MGLEAMEGYTEVVGKKEEPQGRALKQQDHRAMDCWQNCNKQVTFIIQSEDIVRLSIVKDLIGVKSEKEPVDGTCPERLLFERSLHCHDTYISMQQITKSSRVQ